MPRRFAAILIALVALSTGAHGPSARGQQAPARDVAVDGSPAAFAQVRDGSAPAALLDLAGAWEFRELGTDSWRPAVVPGTVHLDLLRLGALKDPYFRDQELDAQWVETRSWEYRRTFRVPDAVIGHDRLLLECRGLDTVAEVFVNGRLVGDSANQFLEQEFDVTSLVRRGQNEIRVVFGNVLEWTRRQKEADSRVTWLEDGRWRKGNLFLTRKQASAFGWDWGARLVGCGIWKAIRLVAYDVARATAIQVRQDLSAPSRARLNVAVEIERYKVNVPLTVRLQASLGNNVVAQAVVPAAGTRATGTLNIDQPRLWWPAGWGSQPLYTVTATLMAGRRSVHQRHVRIGLRTVELALQPDDRAETFGIKVNGRLIFAKGANWVPADAMPARLTEAQYVQRLSAVVDANMNMLRVWGGGVYEPDVFYEFCDEHGVLVWQDFMYAVGPYIASDTFLRSVEAETRNVVLRRRHHPSIALWCGNNESEINMAGGQQWLARYKTVSWADYDRVFHQLIPGVIAQLDPDRPYWPSSPHNPRDREHRTPDWATSSGNAHDYEAWGSSVASLAPFDRLNRYRFVSEFGFQALPDIETLRQFTVPEDRRFPSHILEHHENSGDGETSDLGTTRIARFVAADVPVPATLDGWVYASQIVQAEAVRRGVEALRRNFPSSTGALYWQLTDDWPSVSWSSIDHFGRWKALQYAAARFFSPALVSIEQQDGVSPTPPDVDIGFTPRANVWAINDSLVDIRAVLEWRLARFDGTEVRRDEHPLIMPATSSTRVAALDFSDVMAEESGRRTYRKESYERRRQYYLVCRLVEGGREISSSVAFFVPPKYLALPPPGLTWSVEDGASGPEVTVSAARFAAFVQLGLKRGYARFSDNYFHLLPGERKKVAVVEGVTSIPHLRDQIVVRSLADDF